MVSIGQKLYEARVKKNLSFEDVANATKIKPAFLLAIEKGEYHKLPAASYAKGFVLNYATFLGLPKRETLALFKREFDEEKIYRVLPDGLSRKEEFHLRRIKIQQTALIALIVFTMVVGYIFFQYRYIVLRPPLELYTPKETTLSLPETTISGKTDPNATVFIGNQSVTVAKDGTFSKTISLYEGKNNIVVKSKNRVGKETIIEKEIDVDYHP